MRRKRWTLNRMKSEKLWAGTAVAFFLLLLFFVIRQRRHVHTVIDPAYRFAHTPMWRILCNVYIKRKIISKQQTLPLAWHQSVLVVVCRNDFNQHRSARLYQTANTEFVLNANRADEHNSHKIIAFQFSWDWCTALVFVCCAQNTTRCICVRPCMHCFLVAISTYATQFLICIFTYLRLVLLWSRCGSIWNILFTPCLYEHFWKRTIVLCYISRDDKQKIIIMLN